MDFTKEEMETFAEKFMELLSTVDTSDELEPESPEDYDFVLEFTFKVHDMFYKLRKDLCLNRSQSNDDFFNFMQEAMNAQEDLGKMNSDCSRYLNDPYDVGVKFVSLFSEAKLQDLISNLSLEKDQMTVMTEFLKKLIHKIREFWSYFNKFEVSIQAQ